MSKDDILDGIAIVGMAGRFPKARNLDEFWNNLINGVEGLRHLTDAELQAIEPDYDEMKDDPDYVPATGILDDVELFDADFFGINPREARSIDPQQRLWLEIAWECMENAGHAPNKYPGAVGVFTGSFMNSYLFYNLSPDRESIEGFVRLQSVESFMHMINNERDYLPTRTSYLLNLTGPAINVQTACSTSLVAVSLACQSLQNYESDMALAGGVCLFLPQERGYIYQEGGMRSSDGHCRPFDAKSSGTVFASGLGVVLLKRMGDAVADGDNILAVIKGSALNNDGTHKASYTAPSIDGQAEVIAMAQAVAGFEPDSISYIEAHGTATPIGDPIEIAALTKAFREKTDKTQFCAVGSVKSNIGHLDAASGVAGLMKTVLALQHEEIPPTLHYENPNPEIDFDSSPFYVVNKRTPWPKGDAPRRAGVSSFGVGGTNAHVVLEEAPETVQGSESRKRQLLMLSAKTEAALVAQAQNLATHLEASQVDLADVAYTLNVGRTEHNFRRVLVVQDVQDAISALQDKKQGAKHQLQMDEPSLVFMFPGQGSQYVNMGLELYEQEPVFREAIDQCADILQPLLDVDMRVVLYPGGDDLAASAEKLKQTGLAQPAIFMVSYALAQLWESWGVQPDVMVGHSVGEFVAAALAGVFSLEDALTIIANRAQLMQDLPGGSMRAVRMTVKKLRPFLTSGISLAAHNAPGICIVSGPTEAIDAFDKRMAAQDLDTIQLHTSHAFHSEMMEPILAPFHDIVAQAKLNPPNLPIVSTVTGTWMTDEQAADPNYWVKQLRQAVLFSPAVRVLQEEPGRVLLEVGPGKALSNAALQHVNKEAKQIVIDSLGHPKNPPPALHAVLEGLGRLWMAGIKVDWDAFYEGETRRRVPLPTYPFERKRHWIEPPALNGGNTAVSNQPNLTNHQNPPMQALQTKGDLQMSRQKNIADALAQLMYELSGIEIEPDNFQTSFMEMGYDSLTLTQVSTVLKKKMKVQIRFRKLLEDVSSIDSLAEYCAEKLPAHAYADPEPAPQAAAPAQPAQPPAQPNPQMPAQPSAGMPQMPNMPQGMQMAPQMMPQMNMPMQNPMMGMANPMQMQMMQMQQMMQYLQQQMAMMMGGYGMMPQMPNMPQMPQAQPAAQPQAAQPQAAPRVVEKVVEVERMRPQAPVKAEGDEVKHVRFGPYKTIKKEKGGALTKQQQAHLDALIEKLTAKTPTSKKMAQENRDVQADPRTVAGFRQIWKELVYQVVTTKSKGSRVWDIDGNEYVDITTGFGIGFLGHSPDYVTDAVREQLDRGVEIGPQMRLAGEVSRLVREITGLERVSFCNTGSEAVMASLRMARTYSGRDKIVYFSGDYHGVFDEVLARPQVMNGELHTMPAAPGITEDSVASAYILDYGTDASLAFIRDNADDIAAVLIEPIQSRHPENRPQAFLQEIRKLTQENEIAMIFDEVITGFRVAQGGAQQYYGIQPDICCYGKIVGGGMPIGVVAGAKKYMDGIDGGWWQYGDDSIPEADLTFFAGTFVRHPLALAAAKAVLTHLKANPHLQDWMNDRTAQFAQEMNFFFDERQVPIKINHFSSWFRVEVPTDFAHPDLLFYHLIQNGVYVFTFAQNCFFSVAHSDEDIEFVKNAFKKAVVDLQDGGFLPPAPEGIADPFPLTEGQQEIFLASQLSKTAATSYNESFSIRLRGAVRPALLCQAAQAVIYRHDALHMRFSPEGDWQKRAASKLVQVPFYDWSDLTPDAAETKLAETLDKDMTTAFDLVNGPLVHAKLIKLQENEFVFHFLADHIVYDGWSAVIVIDEVRDIYNAQAEGKLPELEDADSYREYVSWEKEELSGENGRNLITYWQNKFATLPEPLEMPTDYPRPPVKTYQAGSVHFEFDESLIAKAKAAAARNNVSLFVYMLAAYKALLFRLSGQGDQVIGIHTAGQAVSGMMNLLGHAVGILPIRAQMDNGTPFADLLQQVKDDFLNAQDAQPVTLGTLLRALKVPRDASRSPLVAIVFNLDRKVPEVPFAGVDQALIREVPKQASNWDMFLNLYEEAGTLQADCDFSIDLFAPETIERWLGYYGNLLAEVSESDTLLLGGIDLMPTMEREMLLLDWNATDTVYDSRPVFELIEDMVEKVGGETAVTCQTYSLTYQQLNQRANQFAHFLQANGVQPDSLVGLSMRRSIDMIVALLGIWKAGGAYVPLDPDYPASRLAHMITDSGM
ncbi:MAG: aminotransferase class III-fold pyridoxal phosphate-dependent enzyme, partial [Chloroflexi bacterium]